MDPFLGEIRMFAGGYAPVDWAFCNGQLLQISDNQALYSLLGTAWGGDGVRTFGVPDLRGRLPVGQGAGPGLTARTLGQTGGSSQVNLTIANFPAHTHALNACTQPGTSMAPAAGNQTMGLSACIVPPTGKVVRYAPPSASPAPVQQVMADGAIVNTINAGGQPHDNVMPYLAVSYIICLRGMYPDRP